VATYCADSDLNIVWGVNNVTEMADLDGDADATKISNRKTWCREAAYEEINNYLRDTHYTLPLADAAGAVPDAVKHLEAMMAGIKLGEARYMLQEDAMPATYKRLVEQAAATIEGIRTGTIVLDAI
jgi:hypothetical protein